MKLTLATAALVMSLSSFGSAATVNVNAFIDFNFSLDNLPSTLDNNYTAYIGNYSGGALTTSSLFSDINSAWSAAGSYQFATGAAAGYNGYFIGNAQTFTDAAGLAGKNVMVWVTNGSNQNLLMKATGALAGDFLFKADAAIPNSGVLNIEQDASTAWNLELGTFSSTTANSSYGGSYILNTAIPEPSSAALIGAFGAIGLLRRRRN